MSNFIYVTDKSELYTPGIYSIRNTTSGKIYIGSSKNVYYRIAKHKHMLIKDKHDNPHLQNSFNIHGADKFEVTLVERCSEEELAEKENHWITHHDSKNREKGYNKSDVSSCRGNVVNNKTRSKISKSLMDGNSISMKDRTTGEELRKFDSLFDASEYILAEGKSSAPAFSVRMKISQAAKNKKVLTGYGRAGTRRSAYGYKWEVIPCHVDAERKARRQGELVCGLRLARDRSWAGPPPGPAPRKYAPSGCSRTSASGRPADSTSSGSVWRNSGGWRLPRD